MRKLFRNQRGESTVVILDIIIGVIAFLYWVMG